MEVLIAINTPKDNKKLGELTEILFMAKASGLGFTVSKPYGESNRYDFIVDTGKALKRVQVKAARIPRGSNTYRVNCGTGNAAKNSYTAKEIDFIVAYVVPLEAWYIIPISEFEGMSEVWLTPHVYRSKARWETFRDAWHLLRA